MLPPDLRDWLPEGYLVWCILDVIDQLDLAGKPGKHGRDEARWDVQAQAQRQVAFSAELPTQT